MLISGLIPGQGFIAVFCVIHYTLFIVVIIGLVIDLQRFGTWRVSEEEPAMAR